jgi:hypothetical protein
MLLDNLHDMLDHQSIYMFHLHTYHNHLTHPNLLKVNNKPNYLHMYLHIYSSPHHTNYLLLNMYLYMYQNLGSTEIYHQNMLCSYQVHMNTLHRNQQHYNLHSYHLMYKYLMGIHSSTLNLTHGSIGGSVVWISTLCR